MTPPFPSVLQLSELLCARYCVNSEFIHVTRAFFPRQPLFVARRSASGGARQVSWGRGTRAPMGCRQSGVSPSPPSALSSPPLAAPAALRPCARWPLAPAAPFQGRLSSRPHLFYQSRHTCVHVQHLHAIRQPEKTRYLGREGERESASLLRIASSSLPCAEWPRLFRALPPPAPAAGLLLSQPRSLLLLLLQAITACVSNHG